MFVSYTEELSVLNIFHCRSPISDFVIFCYDSVRG